MSSLLAGLQTDNTLETEKDTLGGARRLLESGIQQTMITAAFFGQSAGGALNLTVGLKGKREDGTEFEHKETIYFSNRQKQTYYEKDGQRHPLPGFLLVDSLAFLVTGKSIVDLPTEQKIVNLWNSTERKEVPTSVDMVVDLVGQPVYSAILKVIENKNAKVGDQYVPTNEKRELNQIDKFFRAADKMTSAEVRAGATEATFFNQWVETKSGKDVNKFKEVANAPVSNAASTAGAGVAKPAGSLFG